MGVIYIQSLCYYVIKVKKRAHHTHILRALKKKLNVFDAVAKKKVLKLKFCNIFKPL